MPVSEFLLHCPKCRQRRTWTQAVTTERDNPTQILTEGDYGRPSRCCYQCDSRGRRGHTESHQPEKLRTFNFRVVGVP
jgi:hypothetical protein